MWRPRGKSLLGVIIKDDVEVEDLNVVWCVKDYVWIVIWALHFWAILLEDDTGKLSMDYLIML